MINPLKNQNRSWLSVLFVVGVLGFAALPQSEADERQKDAIIDLLGSETRPAQPLLPVEISLQSEFAPGAGVQIGKVQLREGDPVVIHYGESVAYPLKKDRSIFIGDTIITEQDARVNLIMDDKSVLAIAPYSKLIIDESVYDPDTKSRFSTLRLLFGRIRSIVAKIEGEPNYWVQTPTAVAGVRGSDFGVATTGQKSAFVTTQKTNIEVDKEAITPCMVAGTDSGSNLASGAYPVPCETAAGLVESIGPNLSAVAILGMPPEFD
jgi:FecR protein